MYFYQLIRALLRWTYMTSVPVVATACGVKIAFLDSDRTREKFVYQSDFSFFFYIYIYYKSRVHVVRTRLAHVFCGNVFERTTERKSRLRCRTQHDIPGVYVRKTCYRSNAARRWYTTQTSLLEFLSGFRGVEKKKTKYKRKT